METFVRSARNYVEYREQGSFSHKYDDLIDIAKSGKKPCSKCERQKICQAVNCLPFYIWFRVNWRRIQKEAGIFNE